MIPHEIVPGLNRDQKCFRKVLFDSQSQKEKLHYKALEWEFEHLNLFKFKFNYNLNALQFNSDITFTIPLPYKTAKLKLKKILRQTINFRLRSTKYIIKIYMHAYCLNLIFLNGCWNQIKITCCKINASRFVS